MTSKDDAPTDSSLYANDLATVHEIAELLHVPDTWVYGRTRTRGLEQIPHFKLGKYLRFSRSEVLDWVHRQRGN